MTALFRNAVAIGVVVGLAGVMARRRGAAIALPVLVALGVAAGVYMGMIDQAWAVESFRMDTPWLGVGLMAIWSMVGGGAWLRLTKWWLVVPAAVLFGDAAVVLGIALAEPDADRRARLVVAAGGASLIGPWSGETTLLLGWGGWAVSALGVVLAFVGFTRGGAAALARPQVSATVGAGIVPLLFGPLLWLAILAFLPEFLATSLEASMLWFPGRAPLMALGAAIASGAVLHEGGAALFIRQVLERAQSLRDDTMREMFLVGLSLGSTVPMLVAARARLRTGLGLWAVQVLLAVGYMAWRWS